MAHTIIHHNGAFNVYSSIVDAPIFEHALTREQLTEWYKDEYGNSGLSSLPDRIARAESKGSSSRLSPSLKSDVSGNHAGPDGTELPIDAFIAQFLTLPTAV